MNSNDVSNKASEWNEPLILNDIDIVFVLDYMLDQLCNKRGVDSNWLYCNLNRFISPLNQHITGLIIRYTNLPHGLWQPSDVLSSKLTSTSSKLNNTTIIDCVMCILQYWLLCLKKVWNHTRFWITTDSCMRDKFFRCGEISNLKYFIHSYEYFVAKDEMTSKTHIVLLIHPISNVFCLYKDVR